MIGAITVGFVLSEHVASASTALPFLLMFIVFVLGTSCTLGSLASVVLAPRDFVVTLLVVYLFMPLIGYGVGRLFYSGSNPYAVGHFLVAIIPIAITSTVWTGMSNGNIALSLSAVTVVTVLSGLTIPLQMSFFMGRLVDFDSRALAIGLIQSVVVPVILGIAVRRRFDTAVLSIRPQLNLITKGVMIVLLTVNGAVVRPYIQTVDLYLVRTVAIVSVHTGLNFVIAFLLAKSLLGKTSRSLPTVVYAASMKNNAAGIVIALNYVGPVVALPVVLNMILQQFGAGICYRVCHARERHPV